MMTIRRYMIGASVALMLPLLATAGPVNVNTADAETISAELKGVGLTKAQAIVDYRESNGPFRSASDLTAVKGIGDRTVEMNEGDILVSPASSKTK